MSQTPADLLQGTENMYGGFIVVPDRLPEDPERFKVVLDASRTAWRSKGYRLVWLEIPEQRAALVPIAVDAGFSFHHAEAGRAMLTLSLSDDAHIPPYATHNIGAGGVVIDQQERLLVVNERYRRDMSRPYYKLPGGALDPEENLADAVTREVLEETGIRAQFEGVVSIRHRHQFRFGRSDLYIICRLRPLSDQISHDPGEIEECRWMPVTEYLASEYVAHFNRTVVEQALRGFTLCCTSIESRQGYEFLAPADLDGQPPAAPNS